MRWVAKINHLPVSPPQNSRKSICQHEARAKLLGANVSHPKATLKNQPL